MVEVVPGACSNRCLVPALIPCVDTDRGGGRLWVGVPALVYLKSALYMISRQKGVTKAELARRLKWHREQVDRLFRLDHNSQLDQLEAAFDALGVPLRFDVPFPRAA